MKTEHIAALAIAAFIVYRLASAKVSSATASQQSNNADTQAEWWTYAGTWRG